MSGESSKHGKDENEYKSLVTAPEGKRPLVIEEGLKDCTCTASILVLYEYRLQCSTTTVHNSKLIAPSKSSSSYTEYSCYFHLKSSHGWHVGIVSD